MMDLLAEPAYIVDILDIEPRPLGEMGTILYIRRPPLCIRMEGGITFLQSFLLLFRHILQWQDRDILLSADGTEDQRIKKVLTPMKATLPLDIGDLTPSAGI